MECGPARSGDSGQFGLCLCWNRPRADGNLLGRGGNGPRHAIELGADSEWVIAELEDRIVRDTSELGAELPDERLCPARDRTGAAGGAQPFLEVHRHAATASGAVGGRQRFGISHTPYNWDRPGTRADGCSRDSDRNFAAETRGCKPSGQATVRREISLGSGRCRRDAGRDVAAIYGASKTSRVLFAAGGRTPRRQPGWHTTPAAGAYARPRQRCLHSAGARRAFGGRGVSEGIKAAIEQGPSDALPPMELSRQAKRAINLAYDEARLLGSRYIGTEHLLLGLIREEDGLAGRVLAQLGVELDTIRAGVRQLQDGYGPRPPEAPPA